MNKYKLRYDTVLSILLGTSLVCIFIPFIYDFVDHNELFLISKVFWLAGVTIMTTVFIFFTKEEKEVLK